MTITDVKGELWKKGWQLFNNACAIHGEASHSFCFVIKKL